MKTLIPIRSSRDFDIILGILIGRGVRIITTRTDMTTYGIWIAAKYSKRQIEHLFELADMARTAPENIGQ